MFGTLVIGLLVAGIGGWAATAELSGAVIASGTVVVEKHVKKVQHRDGGIVAKIHVKNGDRVEAGQVIVVLDDTQIRAELGIVKAQLTELTARKARLSAEVDGLSHVVFPEGFVDSGPHAKHVAAGERRLFSSTRSNQKSQKEQLQLQIGQLEQEISGIEAQRKSKKVQLEIIELELAQIKHLHEQQLTSVTRLYALQRESERLRGDYGGLVAQIARSKGKISEINLQILAIEQTARLQAQRELRTGEAKIAELREREIAAKDRLKRTKLHAPQSGIVHELAAHTIGGVITSAEAVLLIVPENEKLTIEARVAQIDIDQVTVGRPAKLRFSAFNQQTTPELEGRVVHVSADVTTDDRTSQTYYVTRVEIDPSSREKIRDLDLLPGMPVEVFISTGARTALSYLSKPITDQFRRAFREE
ncbi:MAG: HlyD family type I secretion periplasmic adaptor subunit [Methyloligellaceae bacterium]